MSSMSSLDEKKFSLKRKSYSYSIRRTSLFTPKKKRKFSISITKGSPRKRMGHFWTWKLSYIKWNKHGIKQHSVVICLLVYMAKRWLAPTLILTDSNVHLIVMLILYNRRKLSTKWMNSFNMKELKNVLKSNKNAFPWKDQY